MSKLSKRAAKAANRSADREFMLKMTVLTHGRKARLFDQRGRPIVGGMRKPKEKRPK